MENYDVGQKIRKNVKHIILQQWRFVQKGKFQTYSRPFYDEHEYPPLVKRRGSKLEVLRRNAGENTNRSAPTRKYSIDKDTDLRRKTYTA